MKRILAFLLAALTLTLAACTSDPSTPKSQPKPQADGYRVPEPMAVPDYSFDTTPTTDQLRQTAIQGMHDLLSIQWHTDIEIAYYKSGPASKKRYEHHVGNTYGGTLYSDASTGLFQFMEFYDTQTGLFSYPDQVYRIKENLGNSCADSLLWGWSAVCNSIQGGFYPSTMVYVNGYLPVGDYTYDFTIDNYNKYPSQNIIKDNGQDVIIDAYTKVQPADALVSTSDNHAMMALEAPHVVRKDDGSIDLAASYIRIQDQRGGSGAGFYDITENGNVIHYSGRISFDFTFEALLEKNYIPVTTAEFQGTKAYEKAQVAIDAQCATMEQLRSATISSNYPMAVAKIVEIQEDGTETAVARKLFSGKATTGVPRSFLLSEMKELADYTPTTGTQIRLTVISSTGETFTLCEFTA